MENKFKVLIKLICNFNKILKPSGFTILVGILMLFLMSWCVSAANCGGAVKCNCGDILTSSQTMWYDLSCSGYYGIRIGASSVVLDCNGHTISGSGSGDGISASTYANGFFKIKNCYITNFEYGIYLFDTGGQNAEISYNEIYSNTICGIRLEGDSDYIHIHDNNIHDNNGICGGLTITDTSNYNTIESNTLCNNDGGAGLDFSDSTIAGNTMKNNYCNSAYLKNKENNGIESSCKYSCDGTMCNSDGDKYVKPICGGTDCDDSNSNVNPGATEICDEKDNDCDGSIDEGLTTYTYYRDADGDNYGNPTITTTTCSTTNPSGYVSNNGDCDDSNSNVNPGVAEKCDGIDNNCDGNTDDGEGLEWCINYYIDADGDSYGNNSNSKCLCSGYQYSPYNTTNNTDCDDDNISVNPGAAESCNGLDDDCDGQVDEESICPTITYYCDDDSDGYINKNSDGICNTFNCTPVGCLNTSGTDCNDDDNLTHPNAEEICNGLDDDCNDQIDEGGVCPQAAYYCDDDNDTYIDSSPDGTCDTFNCTPVGCQKIQGNDCNDNNENINPGQTEICNGIDDDCDGTSDGFNVCPNTTYYCDKDNDTYFNSNPDGTCNSFNCVPFGCQEVNGNDCNDYSANIHPGATERYCNGLDDDCNGSDECVCVDNDGDGYNGITAECPIGTDCNDNDTGIHINVLEIPYDGKNNDCNQFTRDDDLDHDGYNISNDCNDLNYFMYPSAKEVECNSIDEDCDGADNCTCVVDNDKDGYSPYDSVNCPNGLDCDDNNAGIHPGASEIWDNNIDENCDGIDIKSPPPSPYENPDLTIKSTIATPKIPNAGESVTLNILIQNKGTTTQSDLSNVKISLYINDIFYGSKIENLKNTYSKNVDFTFTPTDSGVIRVKVFVDSDDSITESNENNNIIFKKIGATKESSTDAGCNDYDSSTIDLSINGHCVYTELLDAGLISSSETNKVTLDTTVYFYWNVYGGGIGCENLGGGTADIFIDNYIQNNGNLPDADCSAPVVYMKIENPQSMTKIVKGFADSNGIVEIPFTFEDCGGTGIYEISLNKICVINAGGESCKDYSSYGYDYSFDVVEEEFNMESGISAEEYVKILYGFQSKACLGLETGAGVSGYLDYSGDVPRSYTVHYRGDSEFPESDIKNSDVGLRVGKEATGMLGAEAKASLGSAGFGGNYEGFYTDYESDIFEFGTLSDNSDAFYTGSQLMMVPDPLSLVLPGVPSQPIYYNPWVGDLLSDEVGLNNYKIAKVKGSVSGVRDSGGVGIGYGDSGFGAGGGVSLSTKTGTEQILDNSNQNIGFCSYKSNSGGIGVDMFGFSKNFKSNDHTFDTGINSNLLKFTLNKDVMSSKLCYYGSEEKLEVIIDAPEGKLKYIFDSNDMDCIGSKYISDIKDAYYKDLQEIKGIGDNANYISNDILNNIGDAQPIYKLSTSDNFVIGLMLKICLQEGLGFEFGTGGNLFGNINKEVEKGIKYEDYGLLPVYMKPLRNYDPYEVGLISGKFTDTVYVEPIREGLSNLREAIENELKEPMSIMIDCVLNPGNCADEMINDAWNAITDTTGTLIGLTQELFFSEMHLHVIDEYGREIYYNYTTGEYVNEIPGAIILRNITADEIANYTNSTNVTYNIHEIIYIPNGIKFNVYVDANEAHNVTEPYKLVVPTRNSTTNTTVFDIIEDNITQNQTIQYSINKQTINGNLTITIENKTTEICGNGICIGNETIENCPIDCDNESPVIHSAGLIKIGEQIRVVANAEDNQVIPLVFVNIKSSTGEVNLTIPYDNITKTHYLDINPFQSDKFNFTFMVYDNIKKPPVTYNITDIVIKKNVSLDYLNDLNITLPYNLTYYQDSSVQDEIESFRPFDIEFNITDFKLIFNNVTAKRLKQNNLPLIYTVSNTTLNETPSGVQVMSKNEFLFIDPLSVELYLGENATFTTTLKIKKPDTVFDVIKCDTILFGKCNNPQVILDSNYSVVGEWIILNVSSFSAYGVVDERSDLTPIALAYMPQYPELNQNVTIFSIIENQDFGDATNANVSLFIDGDCKISKSINLSSASQKFINFTWNAQVGVHDIIVIADSDNKTSETNETNNGISGNITVRECLTNSNCEYNQFCNESNKCQNLTCEEFENPFNHRCYHNCDLNYDKIYIHDYDDLMTSYKCFLGIKKNCDDYYQNWNLMKQEYQCFINSNN